MLQTRAVCYVLGHPLDPPLDPPLDHPLDNPLDPTYDGIIPSYRRKAKADKTKATTKELLLDKARAGQPATRNLSDFKRKRCF